MCLSLTLNIEIKQGKDFRVRGSLSMFFILMESNFKCLFFMCNCSFQ